MLRRYLLPAAVLVAAAAAGIFFLLPASAANPKLFANVGPGFSISLKDASGAVVTHVDPGTYDIAVTDQSDAHNFHLTGTGGVDQSTGVDFVGSTTWTVTFVDGRYHFQCDVHPNSMKGDFTAGNPPPPPPPPPPPSGKGKRLTATVGPGFTISLKFKGKRVKKLKAGRYTIVVRDRSAGHNFHLYGPGVHKRTGVAKIGRSTWKVRFKKHKRYRYRCDAHPTNMKGSFRTI